MDYYEAIRSSSVMRIYFFMGLFISLIVRELQLIMVRIYKTRNFQARWLLSITSAP